MVRTAGILLAWLVFAAPTARWLAAGWLADGDGRAQLVVAAVLAGLILRELDLRPARARALPIALVTALPPASLLFPDLEAVRAIAVIGSGYGALGLVLDRDRWARLGAAPLLALAVLPVTPMVDAILGWPLRKAIAAAAAALLGGMPLETVISIEGTATHVDLPCAGVRSLWTGAALVLVVALHRRIRPGPRLLAALGIGAGVALTANLARVVAVVGISSILGWPLLAETVHRPLGAVGFALALGLALASLPAGGEPEEEAILERGGPWTALAAAVPLILASLVPPRIAPAEPLPPPPVPPSFVIEAPSPAEAAFAAERGAALVKGHLDGASVVMVESRSWLAHHVPTRCLASEGWVAGDDELVQIGGREVRRVEVTRGSARATALWWFRSGDRTTDDLVVRIRDGWATGRPWTLVSVLVPDGVDPEPVLADLQGVPW